MFNKEFLKNLTILYVEDEEIARKQLEKVLNRLFKEVIVAKNGLEGLQKYQEDKLLENSKIDLILSDINMPQLNGIEMLEKIREKNDSIPIIFTTARSETEYLLKAISLNASYYALKPVDIEDVVEKIQKVCEKKYFEKLIEEKNIELKEYLKVIDNVATIFKMDSKGDITYTNRLFSDTIAYSKEELIEKNFHTLISKNIDKNILLDLWKTVKTDKTWKKDLKFEDKNGEVIYIRSTIFKTANEKEEYISIGFISTEEVNQKREFQKKLITNIKEKNLQVAQSSNNLKAYENRISYLENELKTTKQKYLDQRTQIEYYENEMLGLDDKVIKNLKVKNSEIEDLKAIISNSKEEREKGVKKYNELSKELVSAKAEIEKLQEKIEIKQTRVDDLLNLVEVREAQLRKYDESFEK
ncbi:response regulator [Arcobacter roscoffensis]|uniref:Response regulator n=1 Tax=Arcobacter roscoffensis TaxID=2961520 RepID=A0ABY5E8M3_9BACT|nr:response regulator [Arcobacter roscoffensis]UTJ07884.1 response regulator [Arcobacter roscoffensis]